MVDHLPVGTEAQRPLPRQATLALLVGRITTIKLAYWAALTVFELALPLDPRPRDERFGSSVAFAVLATFVALLWAKRSAQAVDPRVGAISRSIPTIATTFAAATVVASPASLPCFSWSGNARSKVASDQLRVIQKRCGCGLPHCSSAFLSSQQCSLYHSDRAAK